MPEYPTLYKLASTKKVYQWSIELVESSNGKKVSIITKNGYVDGKMNTNTKVISKGKAGRTVLEQAVLEANRKFKDKTDKQCYVDSIKKAKKQKIVRPMLAQPLDIDKNRISFPAFVQEKFDGLRAIANKTKIEFRSGKKPSHLDHIRKALSDLYSSPRNGFPGKGVYLDGELYSNSLPFDEINGITRKETLSDGNREKIKFIQLFVFDFFDLDRPELTTKERFEILDETFGKNPDPNSTIYWVGYDEVNSKKEIRDKFKEYIEDGYEGLMLRTVDGPYELDKRSKHLKKYKEFMDDEFEIVGFHEGEGNDKGTVVWELKTKNGKVFSARPKGTRAKRREMFQNGDKYIGKMMTVIFQEYTKEGVPRFPVAKDIRGDL